MNAFEKAKKEFADFQVELRNMYDRERELLSRLQEVCPHEDTYKMSSDPIFDDFDDWEEEKPEKRKCNECGKILTIKK